MSTSYTKAACYELFLNKALGVKEEHRLDAMKNLIETEERGKPIFSGLGSAEKQITFIKSKLDKGFIAIIKKVTVKTDKDYLKELQLNVESAQDSESILMNIKLALDLINEKK